MEHSLRESLPEHSPQRSRFWDGFYLGRGSSVAGTSSLPFPLWLITIFGCSVTLGYIAFVAFTVWCCFVMTWWKPLIMLVLEPLLAFALSKIVGKATYLLAFNGSIRRHPRTVCVVQAAFYVICVYLLAIKILFNLLSLTNPT